MGYYLPGFKSGGPVRSLSNMVERMSDSLDFYIITRDRDLGDSEQYESITKKQDWVKVDAANVFYVTTGVGLLELLNIIKNIAPDFYYFNSFFDFKFSIRPIFYLRLLGISFSNVVLAPRGEFSDAALSLKAFKKLFYIRVSRFFSFYGGARFHASTTHEKSDIEKNFSSSSEISVASDLPATFMRSPLFAKRHALDVARLVFLSRITPMKNVDYALTVLRYVNRRVDFHIYGPIEDSEYWARCEQLIAQLPKNIKVDFLGAKDQGEVLDVLKDYDLLFLPSRGENYCHVIAESLSVGTRVLVSDKTPWRNLQIEGFGWDLPLNNPEAFAQVIEAIELFDADGDFQARQGVVDAYEQLISSSSSIADNKLLFNC
ncbi:glycosyltransferase [Variovorax boronicumulans]|nr:glycosyltransferase [Variovorax boronicumulans]